MLSLEILSIIMIGIKFILDFKMIYFWYFRYGLSFNAIGFHCTGMANIYEGQTILGQIRNITATSDGGILVLDIKWYQRVHFKSLSIDD